MPREAHSSVIQQLANASARDGLASQLHFRINLNSESHFTPQLRQHFDVACRFVAEMEVVAFMHFAGLQSFFEDFVGELPRRHQRQIASERKLQNSVQAGSFEKPQFFWIRGDQLQSGIRPQDASRMRLERHCYSFDALFPRPLPNVAEHVTVGTMYAVEVPHGHDCRAEAYQETKYPDLLIA